MYGFLYKWECFLKRKKVNKGRINEIIQSKEVIRELSQAG
jgi:hypothetical protein